MSAETKVAVTDWEMEDAYGGLGFPDYPVAVPVFTRGNNETEVRTPMYDTEAAASGLPMYMGGTISRPWVTLTETAAEA